MKNLFASAGCWALCLGSFCLINANGQEPDNRFSQPPPPRPLIVSPDGDSPAAPSGTGNGSAGSPQLRQVASPQQDAGRLLIQNCGVHLIDDVDVPAREAGQLVRLDVREGNVITREQLLGLIDDRLARRQVDESTYRHEIARTKAEDKNQIESTRRLVKFVQEKFEISEDLYRKGSESRAAYLEAQTNLELKRLDHDKAVNEQKIAGIESQAEMVRLQAATDSIERHSLVAPFDGVVFEIFKQRSEWVAAGDRVLRVVRMDKLRVKGLVSNEKYNPADVAWRKVTVTARLANGETADFPGQIVFVAMEKVGSADQFEVWAEVENRMADSFWLLMPGSTVHLSVHLDEPPGAPPASPPPPPVAGAAANQPASVLPAASQRQ